MTSRHSNHDLVTSAPDTVVDSTTGLVSGLQDLSIAEDDNYEVHEDEFVRPEESEGSSTSGDSNVLEDDELERAFRHRVDLVAQEVQHERKPIHTRATLNTVKMWADRIRGEFSAAHGRRQCHIYADGLNKKSYKVWDLKDNYHVNSLQIEYLSRVEMHPDFQHRYGEFSDQIEALREYNEDCKQDCIDTPYTFMILRHSFKYEDQNKAKMEAYRKALSHTRSLWSQSSSKRQLLNTFRETAKTCTPITKVVCFGLARLGAFNLNKNFYHSAIQYMAVFGIIHTLNEHYYRTDPARPLIKLVLQDPNYERKDEVILGNLFNDDDNTSFVSDPEGLLAIDASTLVVTAFLPVQMPLVQIIADLFAEDPSNGPAAIVRDIMTVDVEKREYSLSERASPAVARHFTDHYKKIGAGFDDHGLENELMADAYREDWVYGCARALSIRSSLLKASR